MEQTGIHPYELQVSSEMIYEELTTWPWYQIIAEHDNIWVSIYYVVDFFNIWKINFGDIVESSSITNIKLNLEDNLKNNNKER